MKITIQSHGRTYSAELEDDIGAINQSVRGLLVAVGYHTNTVDEYFPNWEDYQEECECSEPYPWKEKFEEACKTYAVSFGNQSEEFTKEELGEHFGI